MKKKNWPMIQWVIVVVVLATINGCAPSSAANSQTEQSDSAQPVPSQPELNAALQGLVDAQVQEQEILGMAMAVRAADGTVVGAGSGYSDPAGETTWSVDTQSAIASVTKSFTAVVIMQLIEEGKLALDDTIDGWFPDQPNGDKITVRMLLSHTSGLNKYINGPQFVEAMQAGKFATEWATLDLVAEANEAGPVDEPGSSEAHYANTNFALLGLITEAITGNSWEQEVKTRIIGWYLVLIIGLTILMTWLYNNTNGSLLLAVLFHAGFTGPSIFPLFPEITEAASRQTLTLVVIPLWAIVLLVIARFGPVRLSRESTHQASRLAWRTGEA